MNWWEAVILGIVEGVTEYLPVSSTGHLILAQRAMGIEDSEAANAYAICIQAGAIVAVLGLYFKHVRQMSLGLIGKDTQGKQMATNVMVAFMPAAVFGLLFDEKIDAYLFGASNQSVPPRAYTSAVARGSSPVTCSGGM